MKKQNTHYSLLVSVLLHLGFSVLIYLNFNPVTEPLKKVSSEPLQVILESHQGSPVSFSKPQKKLDLRPLFARGNSFSFPELGQITSDGETVEQPKWGNSKSHYGEFLTTPTRVSTAFDFLAQKIDSNLDYPEVLVENGIQGLASLDLYFDHQGFVNEKRSKFSGGHRILRGLLIRAARQGLIEWYSNDSQKLKAHEFRNQHFHAEFEISYLLSSKTELTRTLPGNYRYTRRKNVPACIMPIAGGLPLLDVACTIVKTAGAIKRATSEKYKVHFIALKDVLERYDEVELTGINKQIKTL